MGAAVVFAEIVGDCFVAMGMKACVLPFSSRCLGSLHTELKFAMIAPLSLSLWSSRSAHTIRETIADEIARGKLMILPLDWLFAAFMHLPFSD